MQECQAAFKLRFTQDVIERKKQRYVHGRMVGNLGEEWEQLMKEERQDISPFTSKRLNSPFMSLQPCQTFFCKTQMQILSFYHRILYRHLFARNEGYSTSLSIYFTLSSESCFTLIYITVGNLHCISTGVTLKGKNRIWLHNFIAKSQKIKIKKTK